MTADEFNASQLAVGTLTPAHVTELVRFWQEQHQLVADGIAGPATIGNISAHLIKSSPMRDGTEPAA